MAEEFRSDKLVFSAQQASQKFDYFILALVGALLAYISQHFELLRLGINAGTLELISLVVIVCSGIAGFRRVEATISGAGFNARYLRVMEEHGLIYSASKKGGELRHEQTGQVIAPEEVPAVLANIQSDAKKLLDATRKELGKAEFAYDVRNILLLIGFLPLLGAKVWAPYEKTASMEQSRVNANSKCGQCDYRRVPLNTPEKPSAKKQPNIPSQSVSSGPLKSGK
jgi:hypothetical protein